MMHVIYALSSDLPSESEFYDCTLAEALERYYDEEWATLADMAGDTGYLNGIDADDDARVTDAVREMFVDLVEAGDIYVEEITLVPPQDAHKALTEF